MPARDQGAAMSNLLLASLSDADAARLAPHLRRVTLQRDMIVAQEGQEIPEAIFPCGCLLSAMTVLSRKRVETCTIAADGALGLLQALGLRTSVERVIVQVGGPALAIPLVDLASAVRGARLRRRLCRGRCGRVSLQRLGSRSEERALSSRCDAACPGLRRPVRSRPAPPRPPRPMTRLGSALRHRNAPPRRTLAQYSGRPTCFSNLNSPVWA